MLLGPKHFVGKSSDSLSTKVNTFNVHLPNIKITFKSRGGLRFELQRGAPVLKTHLLLVKLALAQYLSKTSAMTPTKTTKREPSSLAKNYLIAYNAIETIGWTIILYKFLSYNLGQSDKSLYETVKCALIIFQNAAILEVVHAFFRIVSSNPFLTLIQVASRVIVVCGILIATDEARESFGLQLALAAWSITEIIRYGNYTLSLLGHVPYVVTWLRYSTFILLYPIGITGELLCIYAASYSGLYSIFMPNALNFIFDYQMLLWGLMFMYIPLFPKLYLHMFGLRKKVLGKHASKEH